MYSSTKSFSSSEETAVILDNGLFNRKVEEEKNKRTAIPPTPRYSCTIHHVTQLRYFPSLLQPLTSHHQTTLRTLHQWHRVLLQAYREEAQCCTARDQRRDAVERIGCDKTISRRVTRIYHAVATLKHHRIFRLLGER